MELSKEQAVVFDAIMYWKNNRHDQQMFLVGGLAGTGKTTLLGKLVDALANEKTRMLCCTFTGKAASVLSKKLNGYPVTTIHKPLYRPIPPDESEVKELEELLFDDPDNESLQERKADAVKRYNEAGVVFDFIGKGNIDSDDLIIIDEASMVSETIRDDLLSTGARILFVGDHGQLPPVKSHRWFSDYDQVLETIHRQAADNPIIRLSKIIRETGGFGKETKTEGYEIKPFKQVDHAQFNDFGQMLTGKNNTRREINRITRAMKGFDPGGLHSGEKIICLKNQGGKGGEDVYLNGVQGVTTSPLNSVFGDDFINMNYDGELRENVPVYTGHLDENYVNVNHPAWYEIKHLREFDYGYGITVHKSQGSEWDNGLVIDDGMFYNNPEDRKRWLYTAVTRFKEHVVIGV